ncbi:pentapeptide repeat-containing protein [Mycobacterium tuberculosis]
MGNIGSQHRHQQLGIGLTGDNQTGDRRLELRCGNIRLFNSGTGNVGLFNPGPGNFGLFNSGGYNTGIGNGEMGSIWAFLTPVGFQ